MYDSDYSLFVLEGYPIALLSYILKYVWANLKYAMHYNL